MLPLRHYHFLFVTCKFLLRKLFRSEEYLNFKVICNDSPLPAMHRLKRWYHSPVCFNRVPEEVNLHSNVHLHQICTNQAAAKSDQGFFQGPENKHVLKVGGLKEAKIEATTWTKQSKYLSRFSPNREKTIIRFSLTSPITRHTIRVKNLGIIF